MSNLVRQNAVTGFEVHDESVDANTVPEHDDAMLDIVLPLLCPSFLCAKMKFVRSPDLAPFRPPPLGAFKALVEGHAHGPRAHC